MIFSMAEKGKPTLRVPPSAFGAKAGSSAASREASKDKPAKGRYTVSSVVTRLCPHQVMRFLAETQPKTSRKTADGKTVDEEAFPLVKSSFGVEFYRTNLLPSRMATGGSKLPLLRWLRQAPTMQDDLLAASDIDVVRFSILQSRISCIFFALWESFGIWVTAIEGADPFGIGPRCFGDATSYTAAIGHPHWLFKVFILLANVFFFMLASGRWSVPDYVPVEGLDYLEYKGSPDDETSEYLPLIDQYGTGGRYQMGLECSDVFVCQPCKICRTRVPLRGKHCHSCGRCVQKFDHHCSWLGTCIGRRNHPHFVALIVCMTTSIMWGFTRVWLVVEICAYKCTKDSSFFHECKMPTFLLVPTFFLLLLNVLLLFAHLGFVSNNTTTYEFIRREKCTYLHYRNGKNPFDHGIIRNWSAFLRRADVMDELSDGTKKASGAGVTFV